MRKHDLAFRRMHTTQRATVDRIVATYSRATPADIEAGARWYADGQILAVGLSERAGVSVETAAAVISHLSPRTRWGRNVAAATALLTTGDTKGTGAMRENVRRARSALTSSDPLSTLKGPKTRRFALNILGDRNAVTIDIWAVKAALGPQSDAVRVSEQLHRAGRYEALEHAYRVAAARLGVDPTTAQATAWIVARNGRAQ